MKTVKKLQPKAPATTKPSIKKSNIASKTRSLKIGIVLDDTLDTNDGVQQYVRSLGTWLQSRGHTVHYLVGQSKPAPGVHSLARNMSVKFNANRLSVPLPANTEQIKQLLDAEKYDLLHVQMPFSPQMAGKIIAQADPKTAVVATFHILPYGLFQRLGSKALAVVQKASLERLDAICSVSHAAATFAQSHFRVKSVVIPNMIDTLAWKNPLEPHPYRIVFLGRLVERKGAKQLIDAVHLLPEELKPHVEVLIAGDGSHRKSLENLAKAYQLNNIRFLGYIDEADKPALLASAELAVFPALGGESFGIVLLEAMAAGSEVVVGGDNPGYRSVLGNWPEVLVNPADTPAFARMLQRLLTNPNLRAELHTKQQKAVKQYDIRIVGKQIELLYQQALLHRRQEMR